MKQWIWVQLSARTEAGHLAKLCHNTCGLQTQNYNKRPSRLERKGGSAVQPGDTDDEQMSWDQCQESEEERGGCVCGWVAFWSLSTLIQPHFILGCYLHTCCHGDRQENPAASGSTSHTYKQQDGKWMHTSVCVPQTLPLDNNRRVYKRCRLQIYFFQWLKISLMSWFTWFIKVPHEADISQRKVRQKHRW